MLAVIRTARGSETHFAEVFERQGETVVSARVACGTAQVYKGLASEGLVSCEKCQAAFPGESQRFAPAKPTDDQVVAEKDRKSREREIARWERNIRDCKKSLESDRRATARFEREYGAIHTVAREQEEREARRIERLEAKLIALKEIA